MKKMMKMVKGALMLALAVFAGTAEAASATCNVESVPSGVVGVWVTKSSTSEPDQYKDKDDSTYEWGKWDPLSSHTFYCYHKETSGVNEFLYWSNSKTGTSADYSVKKWGDLRYVECKVDKNASKTIYAHFHVHDKQYVANQGTLTIDHKCVNTATTCGNSCGSSSATLNAPDSKVYDGEPYEATKTGTGAGDATITYYDSTGTTEIPAPTEIGSYVVKMTYGTATVQKPFEITHQHTWTQNAPEGAKTTWTCSAGGCPIDSPYVELVGADKEYDGTAVAFSAVKSPNNFGELLPGVTVGEVKYYKAGSETEIAAPKYTGNYVAKVVAGNYTLEKAFSITKPAGGYTDGWEVGNTATSVRYDTWPEALAAAADGDTVYYHEDDRNFETHEFSIGDKDLTLDFGGKTLKYTSGAKAMTLKNTGTGTLTFQNVTIQQPKYALISYQISAVGNIQFGTGVKTTNQATNPDNYLKITASEGTLVVTNGQYECSFAGSYKLRGGQYKSTYGEPTADTAAGYIVRTISGDYDRDIVYHEHHAVYSAEGNVISATCDAQDHEFCGFGTKTATLNAPDKTDDGQPYSLAEIVYSDGFPSKTGEITYWDEAGTTPIAPPSAHGSYTAKTTIGGATAVKAFQVIHVHHYETAANQSAGTVTLTCTTTTDCVYHTNPHVATLTAQNGTYTGAEQDLASTSTNTSDFPTNVVLTYSCEGKPTNVGDYTATMTVADKSVEKDFSIAKASMGDVAASMTATTLNFTGAEQQNTLGSATLGSYNLQSGDYELSGVTAATGSGYSNETYQVTLTAKGDNFSGSKTIEWTIQAPTRTFADNAMGRGDFDVSSSTLYNDNYGDAVGRNLTVADSTKIIFYNGHWFVGMTVDLPYSIDVTSPSKSALTPDENLRVSVSTVPGRVFTGSEIYAGTVKETVFQVVGDGLLAENDHGSMTWIGSGTYAFFRKLRWFTEVSPEMIEQAKLDGKENLVFTVTVGGITGKWEGIKYTDFTITAPVDGFTFAVRANEAADIGATALATAKIRLAAGSSVTTTVEQAEGQVFTEVTGYQVYESENEGTYTYSCDVATHYVTVPDVDNATKVVKVGETVIAGVENVYAVHYGDTVTIVYTPATGYETADGTKTIANVTADTTLTDLPTVTATSYAITYELDGGENDPANPATYTIESETITLADPTKQDYNFAGWDPEGVIAKGSTGDKTFTATWKLATVEFTVKAPENASVTKVATNGVAMVAPYKVLPGTAVTVSYKADEGYLFANGKNTMDAEITVSQGGEQPAPAGTETTEGKAKIGTTYYLTLQKAADAAKDGETVTLVADATADGIVCNAKVTFDINGKTLSVVQAFTNTTDLALVNGVAGQGGFVVNGTVSVNGGTLDASALPVAAGGVIPGQSGGIAVANGATFAMMNEWSAISPNWLAANRPGFLTAADGGMVKMGVKTYTAKDGLFGTANTVAKATTTVGTLTYTETFDTLTGAIAAANADTTVALLADIETADAAAFEIKKDITLDFGAYTVTKTVANHYAFDIPKDVTVTFKGTTGGVKQTASNLNPTSPASMIRNKGNLTIEGGVYASDFCIIKNDEDPGAGTLTVNGGTFDMVQTQGGYTGLQMSLMNWATATINGGTWNGGAITTRSCDGNKVSKAGTTEIAATLAGDVKYVLAVGYEGDTTYENVPKIKGVAIENVELKQVPTIADTLVLAEKDGYATVAAAVAKIGTTYYLTLEDAAKASADGDTVTLLADVTTTARVYFNQTNNVTVDLNGKTVSSGADECFVMGEKGEPGNGTLTITGNGSVIQTYADEDADVVWARRGNVVISNGYFEVNGWCQCVYSTLGSQVKIYGGTFKNVTTKTESNYGDVLNVENSGATTDIQCFGGSYSKDPALGDDAMGGTFVAAGYASYKEGGLWTVSAAMPKATVSENPVAAALGGLDAAYTFTTNGVCPAQPVASKNVDYVVTFDNDVEAGAIRLAAVMESGWTNFPAMKFTAGKPYPLIASMQKAVSVAEMYAMGSFTCGISNISVKTETKMTVQLVMADTVPCVITNVTYTITAKGPTVVPPIGGDPETYPEIKPVEGTNGVYYIEVKTNETTAVEIDGLKETDTVIVPPQINAVNGTEASPISSNQVKVVANATNGTETVAVDITDAFTIKEEGNGVLIELNSNAVVTVEIEGKEPEEIPVTPELTDSEDAVKPLVIDETKVATGVKTIPGLKYSLLSGDKVTKIDTLVKTIVAEDTRVVLEAAKAADPAKFYKIQVAK